MRYRCLVFDHDDTVVDSTAHVHHPAFLDILSRIRPGVTMSLEDYFRINFDPGFIAYCEDVLHFTPDEMAFEYSVWQEWVGTHIPTAYPGVREIMERELSEGGHICVISHSVDVNIRRDWAANRLPEPELVFGWEQPRERRKPAPWPLLQVLERLKLQPHEVLMIDDLKPGYDMAKACGVDFAAALWAHEVPEIRAFMRTNCERCFDTPGALEKWLF